MTRAAGDVLPACVMMAVVEEPLTAAQFRQFVDVAQDIVVITEAEPLDEPGPRIVYVNKAFTDLTGYTEQEALGRSPRFLQRPGLTDPETTAAVRRQLERGERFDGPILNFAKDGGAYWLDMHIFALRDENGRITHFAAIERDVTARTLRELELRSAANTDPLTGLFNRRALRHMIGSAWRDDPQTANGVVMLDLDHFKGLNEDHGHLIADRVLAVLGEVLVTSMREDDYPVRLGGDEFAMVLMDSSSSAAGRVAERIRRAFAHALAEAELPTVTVSVGVATSAQTDLESLMQRADDALRRAKGNGRDQVVVAPVHVSA